MKTAGKRITIDQLAVMVQRGFKDFQERFDGADERFDGVDKRLSGIEGNLPEMKKSLVKLDDGLKITNMRLGRIEADQRVTNFELKKLRELPAPAPQYEVDELKKRVQVLEKHTGVQTA